MADELSAANRIAAIQTEIARLVSLNGTATGDAASQKAVWDRTLIIQKLQKNLLELTASNQG